MKILQNLRTKIGYNLLCRKVKKKVRTKTYHNFESAVTVGILFDTSRQDEYEMARNFIHTLVREGKNVKALGMVNVNEMLNYYVQEDYIKFFSKENISFWCYPQSEETEDFIKKDFDILVNISSGENLAIDYIMGLSEAKFKVSPKLSNDAFADFILQFGESVSTNTASIIEVICKYLSGVKPA